jgi:hypothetical protein
MRWLLIALLVSLVAMLIAAAGMMLHVWARRTCGRLKPSSGTDTAQGQADENGPETEI